MLECAGTYIHVPHAETWFRWVNPVHMEIASPRWENQPWHDPPSRQKEACWSVGATLHHTKQNITDLAFQVRCTGYSEESGKFAGLGGGASQIPVHTRDPV